MALGTTYAAHQGEPLDALLYRVLGRTAGLVEATLAANPGLAATAAALGEGTLIFVPAVAAAAPAEAALVKLWD